MIIYNEILDNFNLKQHVTGPTHNRGCTLDLFITPENCEYKNNTATFGIVSDHFPIMATLNFEIPSATHKSVTFRLINKIDLTQFKYELVTKPALTSATTLYSQGWVFDVKNLFMT